MNSVKTEKDIKTAERMRHVKRPAQMNNAKACHCTSNQQSSGDTWIDQSQRTLRVQCSSLVKMYSSRAMETSPAFAGSTTGGLLGLTNSTTVSAACPQNKTRTRSEIAPRRLAPWKEAHSASLEAKRSGSRYSPAAASVAP